MESTNIWFSGDEEAVGTGIIFKQNIKASTKFLYHNISPECRGLLAKQLLDLCLLLYLLFILRHADSRRAEFILQNIKLYSHLLSFLNTEMAQVVGTILMEHKDLFFLLGLYQGVGDLVMQEATALAAIVFT